MYRLTCLASFTALVLLGAACSDTLSLPPAQFVNRLDTVTLHAIDSTPLTLPGAYNLIVAQPIRTDRSVDFDFALNFRADTALLLPTGVLGFTDSSAFQRAQVPFDQIRVAPGGDYVNNVEASLEVGDVLVLRSRPVACFGSTLFIYGKVEILDVALSERAVTFQFLIDRNCGYRGLEPGTPTQ